MGYLPPLYTAAKISVDSRVRTGILRVAGQDSRYRRVKGCEAAVDVGPQKHPRQWTKGAAPQANPNEQLCPPPWLLER
eukprot:scaffold30372_cov70-Cyclotella_meneghiniana.AAC.1